MRLSIIPTELLEAYKNSFNADWVHKFNALHDSELSLDSFSFYTSVSAVYSSKIEGEPMELDSYIKHKRFGIEYQADYTKKIDDLYDAYLYAQNNLLNQETIAAAHALITRHILKTHQQGQTRTSNMFVISKDGNIEYVAALPDIVKKEMNRFYNDLNKLIHADLTFEETFFFAAMLHLVFVKIHPFDDGNGRTARLIEKWFLAQKLGAKAWFLQSEKCYYENQKAYYKNLSVLGLEYDQLNLSKALPFLQMLASSLKETS